MNRTIPFREHFPIGKDAIHERLVIIGRQIMDDLEREAGFDANGIIHLTVVTALKGGFVFAADLMRAFADHDGVPHLNLDCRVEFVRASSRPDSVTKHNEVGLSTSELSPAAIEGCNVLIADDILDSGDTLRAIKSRILAMKPRSLKTAVLFDKVSRHGAEIRADYVAFEIPDKWVIGYGLDENGLFRNLPIVDILNPETGRPQSWRGRKHGK